MRKNNKGFTLAELLIVVAIIAVLVAVAIPVFTGQLRKSELATDLANVRAAYAEEVATQIAKGDSTIEVDVSKLTNAATKSTVTYNESNHEIKLYHNDDSTMTNTFTVDSDVTFNGNWGTAPTTNP